MTMKFKMDDRADAEKCKETIRETADFFDYVTLADVKMICHQINDVEEEDHDVGWRLQDLVGNHCFIRHVKDGWHLYICDPTIGITKLAKPEQEASPEIEDDMFLNKLYDMCVDIMAMSYANRDGRRKVMVHRASKKKGVTVEEYPCWFHCWTTNQFTKKPKQEGDSPEIITDLLAVCEFQDGHVERIKFDHVRFVEEWE